MKQFDFESMPIVEIVNEIIIDAVNKNASDIHFDPTKENLRLRIRIDGELSDYGVIDKKLIFEIHNYEHLQSKISVSSKKCVKIAI